MPSQTCIISKPLPKEGHERSELSFKSLLTELDQMEQNLKTDFEDLSSNEAD